MKKLEEELEKANEIAAYYKEELMKVTNSANLSKTLSTIPEEDAL